MVAVCTADIGTTRIKALLLTEDLSPGPSFTTPTAPSRPAPDAAEVDGDTLWAQTVAALRAVAAAGSEVAALAISNQRATIFLVDEQGRNLGPGLSWQDTRGSEALAAWLEEVGAEHFARVTGLVPSAVWSLAKILWWRERGLPAGARVATVQDWLLCRLGAVDWVLDHANASLTGLLDIHSLTWDPALVQAAGLSLGQLPSLAPSGTPVGRLSREAATATGLPAGTPLILGGGDQQCAGLGSGALSPGVAAVSLGTAGVVGVPSERVMIDPRGRLACVAHVVPGWWVLEGLENTYSAAHRWGRDLLGEDLQGLAAGVPVGSRGLIFLPYLAGSGAPDNDSRARGTLLGLALTHRRADVARAILEGSTIELVRILNAAREFVPVNRLIASGGGAYVTLLLEVLANLAEATVTVARLPEASLIGAGILAWLGLRRWPDALSALSALPSPQRAVVPNPRERRAYHALYERYEGVLAGLRRSGSLAPWEEQLV